MHGRILIVDEIASNRILLSGRLASACYETAQAADAATALRIARGGGADLILLDQALGDGGGTAVLQALRADPATRDIPVVMTAAAPDRAARLAALAEGADDHLTKPLDEQVLLARIRRLLRRADPAPLPDRAGATAPGLAEPPARFDPPGTVAIVAAGPAAAAAWQAALRLRLADRIVPLTRAEALAPAGPPPDVLVIAEHLGPEGSGMTLLADLRSRAATRDAALCLVLGDAPAAPAALRTTMALDLGADDVLADAFDPDEAALRLRALMRRKHAADRRRDALRAELRLAVIDPLTGLYNRRHALPELARMIAGGRDQGRRCAALAIDVDRFKLVNDRHGHAAGDAVLAEIAARLAAQVRAGDLVARIGGEEFLVALPDADEAGARALAERLRQTVADRPMSAAGGPGGLRVTVSIGVALGIGADETADALVARADRALLAAKAEGRNQVTWLDSAA